MVVYSLLDILSQEQNEGSADFEPFCGSLGFFRFFIFFVFFTGIINFFYFLITYSYRWKV